MCMVIKCCSKQSYKTLSKFDCWIKQQRTMVAKCNEENS